MTTAEFIIGHSADDAAERRQEARKIIWALLAAVFLHLVIGCVLAVSSGLFSSVVPMEEEKPMEMTFMDTSPAPQKNAMFMETDESKQVPEPPKEQTFESNANSVGASEAPAAGGLPVPEQSGKDRPWMDLETHPSSLPNEGAQLQPSIAPQPSAQPSVAPTPQSTPLPNTLAMLTSTPTPAPQPTAASTPQPPKSTYQAMKERTHIHGGITNRGISSVSARGTPLGRYEKQLYDAIGSRWYSYVDQRGDLISVGTARVTFTVDRSGRTTKLKVAENSSNEAFANVCLQSIMEVRLPPIPEDVASTLPPEGLETEISFTTFSNQ
jgi:periplasmic protein TonB